VVRRATGTKETAMTRRISLFVGISLVALAVAAPAALGKGDLSGLTEQQATVPQVSRPDTHDIIRTQPQVTVTQVSRPDSHDIVRTPEPTYLDAADRARRIDVVVPTALTDSADRAKPPVGSVSRITVSATPDETIEWPALGLGFGLGMLLVAGLWLATRTSRRPLAH
jgi:hypothetical protein